MVPRGSETSARCLRARWQPSLFILIIQFDAKICLHFGRSLILYCPRASRAPHGFGGAGERKMTEQAVLPFSDSRTGPRASFGRERQSRTVATPPGI